MRDAISARERANQRYRERHIDRIRERDREYQRRKNAARRAAKPPCSSCNERPVFAKLLCQHCYSREDHARRHAYRAGGYEGVVPVAIKGWGYLAL